MSHTNTNESAGAPPALPLGITNDPQQQHPLAMNHLDLAALHKITTTTSDDNNKNVSIDDNTHGTDEFHQLLGEELLSLEGDDHNPNDNDNESVVSEDDNNLNHGTDHRSPRPPRAVSIPNPPSLPHSNAARSTQQMQGENRPSAPPPEPQQAVVPRKLLVLPGKDILGRFPNHRHFVAGCCGFDPIQGGNEAFLRTVIDTVLLRKMHSILTTVMVDQNCPLGGYVPQVLAEAKRQGFLIWSARTVRQDDDSGNKNEEQEEEEEGDPKEQTLGAKRKQPPQDSSLKKIPSKKKKKKARKQQQRLPVQRFRKDTFDETLFQDITNESLDVLKKRLESPLRTQLKNSVFPKWYKSVQDRAVDGESGKVAAAAAAPSNSHLQVASTSVSVKAPQQQQQQQKFELILRGFVQRYDEPSYRVALRTLHADFHHNSPSQSASGMEAWAREIYERLAQDPADARANRVNDSRKLVLELLYDMVALWDQYDFCAEFAHALLREFRYHRLEPLVRFGIVLDRAQALHCMQPKRGVTQAGVMDWFCRLHLDPDYKHRWVMNSGDNDNDSNNIAFDECCAMYAYWKVCYPHFRPLMNSAYFHLIYNEHLGLNQETDLLEWARPARSPNPAAALLEA